MSLWYDVKILLKQVSQKGFFNLLSANVLVQVVAFASQLLVAGILSPDDIGRIKILQTWLGIFTIIGSMGFNNSTLKLCSENRTKEETQRIFKSGLFFTLITTLGAYMMVLLINQLGLLSQDKSIKVLVPLALFPLISTSFFSLYVSYYQAKKDIKFISNITSINKVLSVLLILGFTYCLGIKGYYIGYNIAAIVLLLVVVLITHLSYAQVSFFRFSKSDFKMHWHYARPSFLSNILGELTAYADILLINFLVRDTFEIGQYSFALTLTVLFRIFPATVQQITIPYFSNLFVNKPEFRKVFKKYSKILVIIVVFVLIVGLIFIPPLIKLLFVGKYNGAIVYFVPLAIGWSIRQYNQIQSALLFGAGKISYIAKSQLITLVFNIVVISVALGTWGLLGAAYASIICSSFVVLLLSRYVKKVIN